MAGKLLDLSHAAQRQAFTILVDGFLKHLGQAENRAQTYVKIVDAVGKFQAGGVKPETLEAVKEAVQDPDNRWMRFINRIVDETDPVYLRNLMLNLGYETFLRGTRTIRENRKKYHCNIPWLILFDPTNACNMHCAGCWSGTYGDKHHLSFADMDKIVTEGKALGTYLYMLTGGEPLVRKKDILKLAEKHSDAMFALYSNSTLIDEELCREVVRLGNITFMLSIEGTPETNDARRGAGHYAAVMRAMNLLKEYGIVYGISVCYTRQNIETVTSDAFIRLVSEKGARFGFYFHYMPVGANAVPDLMPTVEQRRKMIDRIRFIRSPECDFEFYPMDFQNDGEFVGGCIAGGRNYFHINSSGDAEPCVFIHFSDSNIHDKSIPEILRSPLFMAYHEGQPFNRNHLRPCPMLENPQLLKEIVVKTGARQTNEEAPEEVGQLTAKCEGYAKEWAPAAEEIWASQEHKQVSYENYTEEKKEHPELANFDHADGSHGIRSVS